MRLRVLMLVLVAVVEDLRRLRGFVDLDLESDFLRDGGVQAGDVAQDFFLDGA